ncbi:MAG: aminotransferase class IV [Bacteroidales bacterium]|nr:aminotransferase class IV [Bacteroidales bacterium]
MSECFGNKFILNGELLPSDLFDNALVLEGDSVYEVIRMVKGNPVFFHDHIERLSSSVKFLGKEMLADLNDLRSAIISLTDSDRKKETNLKIVFNYNGVARNFLVYNIEPSYPSAEQYKNGVKGILFHAERKDPQSKVINHRLRSEIYHRLILEGAYEAILVNQKNMITEGSRSNIFFLKDNTLITAPENVILSGITRKHIIEICRMENISIGFRCVNADEISDYGVSFYDRYFSNAPPFLLHWGQIF